MYFEIENTPEHLKKTRKKESVTEHINKEECPRLILAPFSRPPQVVFDNVLVGTTCKKELEIFNPLKHVQQITLGKALPPGLIIHLPEECLEVEPETCYCLDMSWTPVQLTALRETIRFSNDNRGRYDVVVVLKSVMNVKGKNNQPKFKVSPGKIKKKTGKKSPVALYKKKIEVICKAKTFNKIMRTIDKENVPEVANKEKMSYDYSTDPNYRRCPFDSPTNLDFNSSEVFSNILRNRESNLHQTYDKSFSSISNDKCIEPTPKNILKPSNKQDSLGTDIFDNLTFTPLKSIPAKNDKLDKGPKIIISVNSESDFDDSLDIKNSNQEHETHSFICVTSSQQTNKWLTVNHNAQYDNNQCSETPTIINKKIPNTSSPKDLNSPNFSINTEFSRISDLSFFPQRFSTERKALPKVNNDTHEIIDESNIKLSSDTYTKESPYGPQEFHVNQIVPDFKCLPSIREQHPKICQKVLFKEQQHHRELFEKNYQSRPEHYQWHNDLRVDTKSPPRSLTPPLQSIPEESCQFSESQMLDKTDNNHNKQKTTFTINRTFDKPSELFSTPVNRQSSWSKKAVRADPTIWKVPASIDKKLLKPKQSTKSKDTSLSGKLNQTNDMNKSTNQSYLNYVDNVYSQSFTVDPFLSSAYFYDKKAVENFEKEFKRWLNCILTPPADLESNVEQQIDVGKAWIENRNKEVPVAPTKEQVCSVYHNSHRLESLRRSARNLLRSPEITTVFMKLNAQIEKKLIAIRNDRNLHVDIGLQKIIMEILLSYNPLWLRIGLEAIYGIVLPLKSNSDIEGLTTFIIQRMFKNPYLKSKNPKVTAPNMLLPAYMEAVKKFTLKKFFILVFFLDKAKQKKLIAHDPCLFRRNAICKESREVIIRFTRELIAGIGDITRHLRPLGYVVSHKQSYLDEYIYAVHNIAVDIRDGVRLTKVMEIILMKNGLLHQLRTPAISRLQKIHNVQVAFNALKEANFVIVGDITATDIADGHREKTLSLLWQIIHVFRAPLFVKAANVIQVWWRKKYEVIKEKRMEEERMQARLNTAASIIQYWWRRVQYNRMVEHQMYRITTATTVIQKYCRMWLCRKRLKAYQRSASIVAEWYRNAKAMRKAKETLSELRLKREELRNKSATIIQAYVRRWLCMKQYRNLKLKVILIQSLVRKCLERKRYIRLKKSVICIQQRYRSKLLMRKEVKIMAEKKESIICIQSYYRMYKQRKYYQELKKATLTLEKFYFALISMRKERKSYLELKKAAIKIQSSYRRNQTRAEYLRQRALIINLQTRIKAHQAMKTCKAEYLTLRKSTTTIQRHLKAFLSMRLERTKYIELRKSAILIQRYFRAYLLMKSNRNNYLLLRKSALLVQIRYRSLIAMRNERENYSRLKNAAVLIQRQYRAVMLTRVIRNEYLELKKSVLIVQRKYRALIEMRKEKWNYLKIKTSCILIQNAFRAYLKGKKQRRVYLQQKQSAIKVQRWFRRMQMGKAIKNQYEQTKKACVAIQKHYRAYSAGKKQREEYLKIKTATVTIQKYYRSYIKTKIIRQEFLQIRKSTLTIQKYFRSRQNTKNQRQFYLILKEATIVIQTYYRQYREAKRIRQEFCQLKLATVCIQRRFRSMLLMKKEKSSYMKMKQSAMIIQTRYRALKAMCIARHEYLKLRSAIINVQNRYRALRVMKQERCRYLRILQACRSIQVYYRAYRVGKGQRIQYLQLKKATTDLQQRYRALILMRKERQLYLCIKTAVLVIQKRYRAHQMMLKERFVFERTVTSCITLQRFYRARLLGIKQRQSFIQMKYAAIVIQKRYREIRKAKQLRNYYIQLRTATILVQRHIRARREAREKVKKEAVNKILTWYLSIKQRNECRTRFIEIRNKVICLQSNIRMYIHRKRYIAMREAAITIQRYQRCLILRKIERENYVQIRRSIIKLQAYVRAFIERRRFMRIRATVLTMQAVYRLKRHRAVMNARKEQAAVHIQKYVRRYLAQSKYMRLREKIIFVQRTWKGKLITRLVRFEYLQKRSLLLKLQSRIRGYMARKNFVLMKENLLKLKEEQRRNFAASKIQALFRGNKARAASEDRVKKLCNRWRNGALQSTQQSMEERNEDALEVLQHMSDIESVIRAFKSLELLTEVFPMLYNLNASEIVERIYLYMTVMNRSISSVEVLKSAASVLVNLTRYRITGPQIYERDRISVVLKFMWRFSSSEVQLLCTLSTYIWLFSKYDEVKKDLTEYLHIPENHKMLVAIKGNIDRMKRMAHARNKVFNTPQPKKFVSHIMNQSLRSNMNLTSNSSFILPAIEPDYGITRADRPRYFEDAEQAISCLFKTYAL